MMDETFLTTEQVLGYLRVNLRTVYRLIKAGKIPAVRVGRQWRFRKTDIDAWLDSQRPRGGAPATAGLPVAGDPRPEPRSSRARVLVVDDEASIRDPLARILTMSDYDLDVETAPDARAALERIRAQPFDLVITDLKMPGMDGLAMLRETKRYLPDVRFIVITGFSTHASAIEAANLGGAVGYLEKPIKHHQAVRLVARALNLDD
jgi:excisionase family DNA binding protein